jgi:hypothetical protein
LKRSSFFFPVFFPLRKWAEKKKKVHFFSLACQQAKLLREGRIPIRNFLPLSLSLSLLIPLVLIRSPASSGHHKDIAEMTTTAQASGGNGNGGGEAAVAADPSAFNAAAATVTADDNDIDAAWAQREPRQECSPAVAAATAPGSQARDEIFTWEAPHATYALGWSVRFFLFALGFRFPFFFLTT